MVRGAMTADAVPARKWVVGQQGRSKLRSMLTMIIRVQVVRPECSSLSARTRLWYPQAADVLRTTYRRTSVTHRDSVRSVSRVDPKVVWSVGGAVVLGAV